MRTGLSALALSCALGALAACHNPRADDPALGDAATTDTSIITPPSSCSVRTLAAGVAHTCALANAGQVLCWGDNGAGELGRPAGAPAVTPQLVAEVGARAVEIAAARGRSCARLFDGKILCWGRTPDSSDSAPVAKAPAQLVLPLNAAQIVAGGEQVCALLSDDSVMCAGRGGQTGDGTIAAREAPVLVTGLRKSTRLLAAGLAHTCALDRAGTVSCWGRDQEGSLGVSANALPSGGQATGPVAATLFGDGIVALAVGARRTCVIKGAERRVVCAPAPPPAPGDAGIASSDAAPSDAAAAADAGSAAPLPPSDAGVVDPGSPLPALTGLGKDNLALAVGEQHVCALKVSGAVVCFGANTFGQAGDDPRAEIPAATPLDLVALGKDNRAIAAGDAHTCVVKNDGRVLCFGRGSEGQLGHGVAASAPQPVAAGLPDLCR